MPEILSKPDFLEKAESDRSETVEFKEAINNNQFNYLVLCAQGFISLLFLGGAMEHPVDTIEYALSVAGVLLTIAYMFAHNYPKIVVTWVKRGITAVLIVLLITMTLSIEAPYLDDLRVRICEVHDMPSLFCRRSCGP